MELKPGERVGAYRLVAYVGPQGTADLWRAQDDSGLEVTVRLGQLRNRSAGEAREYLESVLGIAAKARHPNLVLVLSTGIESDRYFIISEPTHGLMLKDLLERANDADLWPNPWLGAYIVHQVAKGLGYVHELPGPDGQPLAALHRELNPGVIVVEDSGRVKLAEMVSSVGSQDLVETAGQTSRGVVAYLSPESVSEFERTDRSDIFSIGAVFWELLTERPPFDRETDLETMEAIRTADLPPVPVAVPEELLKIARRCLERNPERRYESPWEVSRDLEAALQGTTEAGPRALSELISKLRHQGARTTDAPRPATQTAPLSVKEQGASTDRIGDTLHEDASPSAEDPFFDEMRDGAPTVGERFEVRRELGSGAMGQIFEVYDHELDELVALKIIPPEVSDSERQLERLKREVKLARRIASAHVCRIFDIVDLGGGGRGLTMAVVDGRTLAELMRAPFEPNIERVAQWGADIADGLAAAHGLDIVHRDLKPENIMIRDEDDRAILLDFGIARPKDQEEIRTHVTQQGVIMGTPLYMSPEQLLNQPLDGRSDLYSLGLILAELVTGQVPLAGRSYAEILDRRARPNAYFQLGDVAPGVPPAFTEIVDRLLCPNVTGRPATATAVKDLLRGVSQGDGSRAQSGVAEIRPVTTSPGSPGDEARARLDPTLTRDVTPPPAQESTHQRWVPAIVVLLVISVLLLARLFTTSRSAEQDGPSPIPAMRDLDDLSQTPEVPARKRRAAASSQARSEPTDAGVFTGDAETVDSPAGRPRPAQRRRPAPTLPPVEEM